MPARTGRQYIEGLREQRREGLPAKRSLRISASGPLRSAPLLCKPITYFIVY
jgi:hypothetical protein